MDTSTPPAVLLQCPKYGHTVKTPRQKTYLNHCRNTFVSNLLQTEL